MNANQWIAKNITRHSVVIYNSKQYMIETKYKRGKCILIGKDQKGIEIDNTIVLTVRAFPAQLAMEHLATQ